eukprot:TRINITY_DN573_c0_g1_i3.p1 TRINITY_DN573_c0_g1~~TRINITY_DN573_c0_g1_i3.p1  ORF type:complete len:124 (-),score=9.43 TRINITY_DN573_c0_g1_i3:244-615(-)
MKLNHRSNQVVSNEMSQRTMLSVFSLWGGTHEAIVGGESWETRNNTMSTTVRIEENQLEVDAECVQSCLLSRLQAIRSLFRFKTIRSGCHGITYNTSMPSGDMSTLLSVMMETGRLQNARAST